MTSRPAHTAAEVRDAEAPLLAAGRGEALMRQAAAGLAAACRRELAAARERVSGARVSVLAGPGNNGGDALFAAANLAARGAAVRVLGLMGRLHDAGAAAARRSGAELVLLSADEARAGELSALRGADLVIDGLLGTGAKPGLRDDLAALLADWQEGAHSAQRVVAVDAPTGVDASTGLADPRCVHADVTVTFGFDKVGLHIGAGADAAGRIEIVDIGLPAPSGPAPLTVLDEGFLDERWPAPEPDDHKYSRGVAGVLAGSERFPGAGVLCSLGAVSAGVGVVRVAGPDAVRSAVLAAAPEAVPGWGRIDALALGSGAPDEDLVAARLREAAEDATRLVVDAGALPVAVQTIAEGTALPAGSVLTPHLGELRGLLTALAEASLLDAEPADPADDPMTALRAAASAMGATVLLKGRRTLISAPDGRLLAPPPGPAALATAGSGDVLAGILAALQAVGARRGLPAEIVAALGVMLHNRAGTAAVRAADLPAAVAAASLRLTAGRAEQKRSRG